MGPRLGAAEDGVVRVPTGMSIDASMGPRLGAAENRKVGDQDVIISMLRWGRGLEPRKTAYVHLLESAREIHRFASALRDLVFDFLIMFSHACPFC